MGGRRVRVMAALGATALTWTSAAVLALTLAGPAQASGGDQPAASPIPGGSTAASSVPSASREPAAAPTNDPAAASEPGSSEGASTGSSAGASTDSSASPSTGATPPAPSASRDAALRSQAELAADNGEVEADPALGFTKTASPTRVRRAGEVVTYTLTAQNIGNVDLTDVVFSDDLPGLGPLDCDRDYPATLAPADRLSCTSSRTVTQDDIDFGAVFNVAEVAGEAPGGDPEDPQDDVVAVDGTAIEVDQRPGLAMAGTVGPAPARTGDRLTYAVSVTNTGNVTLTGVRVRSDRRAVDGPDCTPRQGAALAPGEVLRCTARYRVRDSDARSGRLVTVFTATGTPPYPEEHGTASGRVRLAVDVVGAGPGGGGGPTGGGLADTGGPGLMPAGVAAVLLAGAALSLSGARPADRAR